jgi:hypothetical protein
MGRSPSGPKLDWILSWEVEEAWCRGSWNPLAGELDTVMGRRQEVKRDSNKRFTVCDLDIVAAKEVLNPLGN